MPYCRPEPPPPLTNTRRATWEFVSFWSRAYDAIAPHMRTVGAALAGAALVIAATWIATSLREGGREDATEMFGRAVKMYEAELITADAPAKPEEEVPRFKTAEERGQAVIGEIEKLEKQHRFSAERDLQFPGIED